MPYLLAGGMNDLKVWEQTELFEHMDRLVGKYSLLFSPISCAVTLRILSFTQETVDTF